MSDSTTAELTTRLEAHEADLKISNAKTAKVEEKNKELESKLKASEEENEKERIASIRKGMRGMTDDESKDYLGKAKKGETNEKVLEAIEEMTKGLKSSDTESKEDQEKTARVAALEKEIIEPKVAKLIEVRKANGVSDENIVLFAKSLTGKSFKEISDQYEAESFIFNTIKTQEPPGYVLSQQPLVAKISKQITVDSEIGVAL